MSLKKILIVGAALTTLLACQVEVPSQITLSGYGGAGGSGGGNIIPPTVNPPTVNPPTVNPPTANPPSNPVTPPAAPAARTVVFNIANGTGNGAWNSASAPIEVRKGDTIRFMNLDATVKALHTSIGPCAHQMGSIPTGGSFDCVVSQNTNFVQTNANNPDTYNHLVGPAAAVHIKIIQ